jgi:hypothetical protein
MEDFMNMQQILSFEESVKVGDFVEVFWTNSGSYFSCPGKIIKVNDKSFRVQIDRDIPDWYSGKLAYGKGHAIKAPKYSFSPGCGWSFNNRIAPLEAVNG